MRRLDSLIFLLIVFQLLTIPRCNSGNGDKNSAICDSIKGRVCNGYHETDYGVKDGYKKMSGNELNEYYSDCDIINGNIKIYMYWHESQDYFATLDLFKNIRAIKGNFSVSGFDIGNDEEPRPNKDYLKSLKGLSNLECISGELELDNHLALISLSGLEKLKTFGRLNIWDNAVLSDISALSNVTEAGYKTYKPEDEGGYSIAFDNNNLTNLRGLENLKVSNLGVVFIKELIEDFSALKNIEKIHGHLAINTACSLVKSDFQELVDTIGRSNIEGLVNISNDCGDELFLPK